MKSLTSKTLMLWSALVIAGAAVGSTVAIVYCLRLFLGVQVMDHNHQQLVVLRRLSTNDVAGARDALWVQVDVLIGRYTDAIQSTDYIDGLAREKAAERLQSLRDSLEFHQLQWTSSNNTPPIVMEMHSEAQKNLATLTTGKTTIVTEHMSGAVAGKLRSTD